MFLASSVEFFTDFSYDNIELILIEIRTNFFYVLFLLLCKQSGQPLTILGSTGPVLVFETIVYKFCLLAELDFMSFRFWIGTWIAVVLLVLVAIDASALVCYITRFTEENFATLIAFIFIFQVNSIWNG